MITLESRFFPLRTAACFLIEGGIILLSVLISFLILSRIGEIEVVRFHDAIVRGVVIAFFAQCCMYMLDLYDFKHTKSLGELFFSLVFSMGTVCIGIGLISYIVPEFGIEGGMYYLTILFFALFLLAWRFVFDFYLSRIAPRENILIVGTGDISNMVAGEIKKRERLGFRIVGFIRSTGMDDNHEENNGDIIGDYSNMATVIKKNAIRRIVVATNERRGEYPVKEMLSIRAEGCQITEWPHFFEKLAGRIPIDNLAPSYFIFNEGFRKSKSLLFFYSIISTTLAGLALIILAPVFLLIGLFIKLDSPGPIFYSQQRVGRSGKVFRMYKFRSMRENAERDGAPRWAMEDDPRITKVGRIIRMARIDELPQLYNIFRGDLAFVGPRPERPEFVAELEKVYSYYSLRHTVKPGLTGWAQVMFTYCGTIEESKEKMQYDLFYVKNMSIKLDLLILFCTAKIVILGRGAR